MDRLAALLEQFCMTARTFHSGALCGMTTISGDDPDGQMHLIRQGRVDVRHGRSIALRITQPSLLFYPRPMARRFVTDPDEGADFVCARIAFEGSAANPIVAALPPFVCLPLAQLHGSEAILDLIFAEATGQCCGRKVMLDRLFEVLLIKILRKLMERGQVKAGMLAGLAHPQLQRAIVAMHEKPEREWTLEELANAANMSRSAFARVFRETVGDTPGTYLQRWRIGLAQKTLLRDRPLKLIAEDVGYGSEAALSRAFKMQVGMSPRDWRKSRDIEPTHVEGRVGEWHGNMGLSFTSAQVHEMAR